MSDISNDDFADAMKDVSKIPLFQNDFPGVDMGEEHDVLKDRRTSENPTHEYDAAEYARNEKKYLAEREEQAEIDARSIRGAALEIAQKQHELLGQDMSVGQLIVDAKAIEDYIVTGTQPEGPPA